MTISKEDLSEWLVMPGTVELRHTLKDMIEEVKHAWSRGAFTSMESTDMAAHKNAEAIGRIHAIEDVLLILEVDDVADNS